MITPTLGRWDGLDLSSTQWFPSIPNYVDVRDVLDPSENHFEGSANTTLLDTTANRVLGEVRWSGRYTYRALTHSEQRTLFAHFSQARGASSSFWMPSWRSDFRIWKDVQPIHGNQLYVRPNEFEFIFQAGRYGICILDHLQTVHVFRIDGYDPVNGILYLSAPHGLTLPMSRIQFASIVRRVRSAGDAFRWTFITDAVVDVPIDVIEVIGEGVYAEGPSV